MGGFIFNYDAGETLLIDSTSRRPGLDWYRVDANRALALVVVRESGNALLVVVDHSGGPGTLTVGTPVSVPITGRPTLTKLTESGDWLLFDAPIGMTRLTLSGTVITVGDEVVTTNEWFYDDPSVPLALWEGHSTPTLDRAVTLHVDAGGSHMDSLGIDIDHVLVVGTLYWDGNSEDSGALRRAFVIDLTTGAPSASFSTGPVLSNWCAGQIDAGDGYWWAWDTWLTDGSDPSGLHLVLVSTDGTSLTTTDVAGYAFGGNTELVTNASAVNLGPDTDGKWWLFAAENAQIEPLWTNATPFTQRVTNVQIDGTSATTVDYVSEQDVGGTYFPHVAVTDGCSSMDTGFMANHTAEWSWKIADEHIRAENNGFSFEYEVAPPHRSGIGAYVGASDKRLLHLWWNSGNVYVAALIETAIPPTPFFDFVQSDDTRVVTVNADHVGGFSTPFNTRDSYWHPILEYRWEWDDGTPDAFTTHAAKKHLYARSGTHVAGSQTADTETLFPELIGEVGYYFPLLLARNSVGWSYAEGGWLIEVDSADSPLLTAAPRDTSPGFYSQAP